MATNLKATLFDHLRASGLLEPAQLEELGRLPEASNPDPRALGRLLVQRGLLTRFQVNLLAQGRAKDLVVGPYLLLDRLGEGGMGQVFKARHRHMHRTVALKVIRKERLQSPEAVQRFYQEAQAAAQLHHPHIVLAYDAGQAGATHYLAMEYVDGTDLARLVKEEGPLPVAQACDYVRQAALGLQHAHERGMVHRDVKPHNLLVTARPDGPAPAAGPGAWGLVKVLDMGLARLSGLAEAQGHALTRTGQVIGSPEYLAPEQALDARAADVRSDLYSLGCTLYYLLAGVPPFQAESLTQLLLKHQMEEPVPLEQRRPDVPEGVCEIVGALLAKRPEDRFQAPAELAAALEPYCRGEGAAAPRPPAARPTASAEENAWATLLGDETPPPRVGARDATASAEEQTPARRQRPRPGAKAQREEAGTNKALLFALIGVGALIPLLAVAAVGAFLLFRSTRPRPSPPPPVVEIPRATEPLPAPPPQPAVQPNPPEPNPPQPPLAPNPPPAPYPGPPLRPNPDVPVTEVELRRLPLAGSAFARVILGADGHRLLVEENQFAYLFDFDSGRQLLKAGPVPSSFTGAQFTPDGRRAFLSAMNGTVYLWDLDSGVLTPRFSGQHGWVKCVAVSPDGRRVFSGGGSPQHVDGRAVYEDCNVYVWDADTGKEVCRFAGHKRPVDQVAVFPDGGRVLSNSADGFFLWDATTGREIRRLAAAAGDRGGIRNFVLFPDGRQALLAPRRGGAVVWDLDGDREAYPLAENVGQSSALALAGDGHRAVTTSGPSLRPGAGYVIHLWELPGGRELRRFEGHTGLIQSVALSPDASRIVSASWDKTIRVWDTGERLPVAVRPPPFSGPKPAPAARLPLPSEAEQAEAEQLIKKAYKEDYAKKPAERAELAVKLLDKAKATTDDPAGRYVLLREARDLAAAAGDAPSALAATDQLAQLYEVKDADAMRLTALTTAAKAATKPEAARALAESALAVVEELVADEDYQGAGKAAVVAEAAAAKAPSAALLARAKARAKEVQEAEKDHDAAEAARATLRQKPDDAEANRVLGAYLCFRKGDWDAGLPLLAKAGDKALQEAAEADLARPTTAEEQKRVGDRWWDLAVQKPALGKTQLRRRAAYWYQQAVPGLAGLTLDKVQERLKEVAEETPDLKPAEAQGGLRVLTGHTGRVTGVAFFPDGQRLVSSSYDGTLRYWDVQTGREVAQSKVFRNAEVTSVATDGTDVAAGTLSGQAILWEAETRRQFTSFSVGQDNPVECVAFAGTDQRVIFGTAKGDAWLWPRKDSSTDLGGANKKWLGVNGIGVSSKGNFALLACSDGLARLVDLEQRQALGVLAGHKGPVLCAALAPNGRYAVTGSTDKTARFWNVKDGRTLRVLSGHGGKVLSVAFTPDSKYVVTGGEDRTVRLWDPGTGRELRRFTGHEGPVTCVAVSPDVRLVASASDDKTIRLWELSRAAKAAP